MLHVPQGLARQAVFSAVAADGVRILATVGIHQVERNALRLEAGVETRYSRGVAVGDGAIGLDEEQNRNGSAVDKRIDRVAGQVEGFGGVGAATHQQQGCENS